MDGNILKMKIVMKFTTELRMKLNNYILSTYLCMVYEHYNIKNGLPDNYSK